MKISNFFSELWQNKAVKNLLLPWAVVFLILNLANTQDGGPNAVSRFLMMRAMSEEATFRIDDRIGATADWAKTPDGHYYSNKAPGPMLLGFPTFFVIDQIPRLWEHGFRDEHGQRHTPGYFQKTWTSFLNQMFPLLLLLAFILIWLRSQGVSKSSQVFFVLAVFFGSTVSLFYNNYFGHALNAILQLGLLYSLLRHFYGWSGFFAAAALLSDYGFIMQIPAFLVVLALQLKQEEKIWTHLHRLAHGALIPAILWIWYHVACYGSPFLVANNFQNPDFQDTIQESVNLFGIFRIPNLPILEELLVGQTRGLLFTQPWIFLLFFFAFYRMLAPSKSTSTQKTNPEIASHKKLAAIFCGLSLVGLLIMNMSYGGWHGGGTAGPRYISGIFLCFALWVALELDSWLKAARSLLWATLLVSIVFRGLVYGSTILGPNEPLWQWYAGEFLKTSKTPWLRASIYFLLLAGAALWQRSIWKKEDRTLG